MTALARRLWLSDEYGLTLGAFLIVVLAGVAALIAVVMLIVVVAERAIGRTTCANWSAQTGYTTKFVVLNFIDTGTCLARTPSGRWVLNTRVTAFVRAGR